MLIATEDFEAIDSEDFSEEEAQKAIVTKSPEGLKTWLLDTIRGSRDARFTVKTHQLRRRGGHLYYRVRMVAKDEPDKVVIFQVDWVKT